MTKASQNLGYDEVFGVYSYYVDSPEGTEWTAAFPSATEYFSDASFAYSDSDGVWGGNPTPYYWPLSGSLMFAGYCPHQSESDAITAVSMEPNETDVNPYLVIDFTQKTTPGEMVDLLWFDVNGVASEKTVSKASGVIDIEFRHALSKVSFGFVDTYGHYKLKSVILKGVVNKGTFYSGLTAGWLPDLAQVAPYTLLSVEYDLKNKWTSPDLYIIPQYLDGIFPSLGTNLDSGVDVVLEFDVTDNKNYGSQTIEIPLKNITERWELGKSYTYEITVNSDPIEFDTPAFDIKVQTVTM